MIAIINYGMGNLQSVANALSLLKKDYFITSDPKSLKKANAVILPGVGAFKDCINNLKSSGFYKQLTTEILTKKKPFLGICLGMQVLARGSYENGYHEGFGWIDGVVEQLVMPSSEFKLPHIGWNDVSFKKNTLFKGIPDKTCFYFVHSYHLKPDKHGKKFITSECHHGTNFASSLQKEHIFGVQFHPEKSQAAGLKMLSNFIDYVGNGR